MPSSQPNIFNNLLSKMVRLLSTIPDGKSRQLQDVMSALRPHFDEQYYLSVNLDVAQAGRDALKHYCEFGWKEGRDPTRHFSTKAYIRSNPDLPANTNPFWHHIVTTDRAKEQLGAKAPKNSGVQSREAIARVIDAIRQDFDETFYLSIEPDLKASHLDPIEHFATEGWKQGLDPNSQFSVTYYLETNPDVVSAGINPFWHYVIAGKAEGRLPARPGGYRTEKLLRTIGFEDTVSQWRCKGEPEFLLKSEDLVASILPEGSTPPDTLLISIVHDDYTVVAGGVQFCIQNEEYLTTAQGNAYLCLSPYQPLPRLAHDAEQPDVLVSAILNGRALGSATMSVVIDAARKITSSIKDVQVVVHHLLGHSPEQVADLIHATGSDACMLWLHDFFTLCPSHTLQRNGISFCGAPPLQSNSCGLCLYGDERRRHLARMHALFESVDINVLAPSQFAADFWQAHTDLTPATLQICPHMTIGWTKGRTKSREKRDEITVAFVGYPAPHKGWPQFERLVSEHRHSGSGYRFMYFGTSEIGLAGVETVRVHVTGTDPDAMVNALAEHGVDLVLHWASWPETFSLATHEAMAAGAWVLTNPVSGNVARAVNELGMGVVLDDEADLEALFRDGRAEEIVANLRKQRRGRRAKVERSDMALAVIRQGC